jgi:hypothetical protein
VVQGAILPSSSSVYKIQAPARKVDCSSNNDRLLQELTNENSLSYRNKMNDGGTPLHRFCQYGNSSVDEIRRLIDEDPEALTKQNNSGQTPLHMACLYLNHSPEIMHCLLDRCPPEAIGLRNINGYTVLHDACARRYSVDIIRRMARIYPKALRMRTNIGKAPLHMACRSIRPSLDVMQLLASECPIVCLLHSSHSRTPYDQAVYYGRSSVAILNFLLEAKIQAAMALLVCVNIMALTTITAPPAVIAVIAHVQRVIPTFAQQGFSMSYMSNNLVIRQVLENSQTLNDLIYNGALQEMIKDEDYQDVACGVSRMMIKANSRINLEMQLESKHHISILESVSDTPDCFYLHLRNNPSLCCRTSTTTNRVTHHRTASSPASSPVHVVVPVPTNSANESASVDQETSHEESGRKRKASD